MSRVTIFFILITSSAHGQSDLLNKFWVSDRPLKISERISLQSFSLSLDQSDVFEFEEWFQEAIVTEKIDKQGIHHSTSASFMMAEDKIYFEINLTYWNYKEGDVFSISYKISTKNGVKTLHAKTDIDEVIFFIKE